MNKLILVIGGLVLLVSGFFVLNNYIYEEKQTDGVNIYTPERDVHLNRFEDVSVELTFDYFDGVDGYEIDDITSTIAEEAQGVEVVKSYRIINGKEKLELENSEGAREGPPSILVTVFRNDLNQSASMWVDAFPRFSNIELVLGDVNRDVVVGGANAVRYTTDGLYVTDNVVVANGSFIYHFAGSYHEPDSIIHQDFRTIIDSVQFVPPVDANVSHSAKIDVEIACRSALAYMLFQTGEQSEQFITECVNGEHPDIIERYIDEMGFDAATI